MKAVKRHNTRQFGHDLEFSPKVWEKLDFSRAWVENAKGYKQTFLVVPWMPGFIMGRRHGGEIRDLGERAAVRLQAMESGKIPILKGGRWYWATPTQVRP